MSESNFSAKEPSLGYYYQLRLGLYLIIKVKDKPRAILKLENLDDIVIEDVNRTDLYRTKLHINSIANLTNSSPDFWKTIRVWSEGIINGTIDIDNTFFTLMTTAKIGADSFIEQLKIDDKIRDADSIERSMLEITTQSTSITNTKAYDAFKSLTKDQRFKLINNINIIDNSLSIDQALNSVRFELRFATYPKRLESLIERLEGWWFQICISMLQKVDDCVSLEEIKIKIADINDSLKDDNLPDDFANPIEINEEVLENYHDKLFVTQLKLIAVRSNVLRNAVNDFHRAFKQRSKWLREEPTSVNDEDLFEQRLQDHWANIFSIMKDECEGFTEDKLERTGYEFYKNYYINRVPPIKIRERFTSEYLTRGSCHILSDKRKIGWHPNYNTLLK